MLQCYSTIILLPCLLLQYYYSSYLTRTTTASQDARKRIHTYYILLIMYFFLQHSIIILCITSILRRKKYNIITGIYYIIIQGIMYVYIERREAEEKERTPQGPERSEIFHINILQNIMFAFWKQNPSTTPPSSIAITCKTMGQLVYNISVFTQKKLKIAFALKKRMYEFQWLLQDFTMPFSYRD